MSGKFRKCFIPALISVFGVICLLFAQTADQVDKQNVTVNGYNLFNLSESNLRGLQFKATGDMYLRQGNYAYALNYYEQAAEYLPNEADIYFNLGNIYLHHNIFSLASRYYQKAIDRYAYPENVRKSKKNLYLSKIRRGWALEKLEFHEESKAIAYEVFGMQKEITNAFPEIRDEMIKFFKLVYGDYYDVLMSSY